jgi:hypothetical protein
MLIGLLHLVCKEDVVVVDQVAKIARAIDAECLVKIADANLHKEDAPFAKVL